MANEAKKELPVLTLCGYAQPVSGYGPGIKGPAVPVNEPVVLKLWNEVTVSVTKDDKSAQVKKTLRTLSRVMLLGATVGDGPMLVKVPSYKCQIPAGVVTGNEPWALKLRFKLEDGSELEMPVLSTPGGSGGGALHLAATGDARKRVTFAVMLPVDRDVWAASMKALNDAAEAAKAAEAAAVEQQSEPVAEQTPVAESKTQRKARLKAEAEAKRAAMQAEQATVDNDEPVSEVG